MGKYKRLLLGAGILRAGWEKTYSKANRRASRYDLTPWALDELKKHWGLLCPTPNSDALTVDPCVARFIRPPHPHTLPYDG